MTILQFITDILGLPVKYQFLTYIICGVIVLVLLDGILTFLFSSISDLTSRR